MSTQERFDRRLIGFTQCAINLQGIADRFPAAVVRRLQASRVEHWKAVERSSTQFK
jgi:hypothetical protein